MSPLEPINGTNLIMSCGFGSVKGKLLCHLFSNVKMEEYVKE